MYIDAPVVLHHERSVEDPLQDAEDLRPFPGVVLDAKHSTLFVGHQRMRHRPDKFPELTPKHHPQRKKGGISAALLL